MSHDPPSPASPSAGDSFTSLLELRDAQTSLGEQRRTRGESAALWDAVADFVRRGSATGVLIEGDDERWSVQGVLDYWAAALERAGRPRSDSWLVEFDAERAPQLDDESCPYLGLAAFQEQDRAVFFGREGLADQVLQQLAAHRVVALVGPSGSGKSSLAFAGVLPRLRDGALPGSEHWRILPAMLPGARPLEALARLLAEHAQATDAAPAVIVVDQFEELFTLCESEADRQVFVDYLLLLAAAPAGNRLVLTVRSDFESFVARYPALYEAYAAGRVAITAPSAAELRRAVEGPAEHRDLHFEPGVVDLLLQELLGEPAGLPLLQFTLLRLWEERTRNRVTADAYERVGGGRQALARSADATYAAMIPEDQETARRILLLVGLPLDERHELTRTRVPRRRFLESDEAPDRVERVLDRLIAARLLRQTAGAPGGEPHIEVAHEALVRNWPQLAQWLQEAQASLVELRKLEERGREWVALGRDRRALLDEMALRRAEGFLDDAKRKGLRPSGDLIGLVAMSRLRSHRHMRRHNLAIAGLAAIAIALVAMLWLTVRQHRLAEIAQASARIKDRQLQIQTMRLLGMANFEQGRTLLLDGRPMSALPYLVAARGEDVQTPALRQLFAQAVRGLPRVTLLGHGAAVKQAAFSPDGSRVLTRGRDRTARIWNAATGAPVASPIEHQGLIAAAAFSPDGTRVATASFDRTARIWDAATGAPVTPPLEHLTPVLVLAFSPDGTRVVTASVDANVRVWDARSGKPVTAPLVHGATVQAAAFSPDGTRLVTACADGGAHVWAVATGASIASLAHGGPVTAVAFSPDGARILTASTDHTARIWNAATGASVITLGHRDSVEVAAFSPDGTRVLTASDDRTARIWNAATGEPIGAPIEHRGRVFDAAFSPDGTRIVTASDDKTAQIWDVASGKPAAEPFEHQGSVNSAVFSPDGARVVTASDDKAARIWSASTGPSAPTYAHPDKVATAAISPDGTRVVTTTDDAARVWDAATARLVATYDAGPPADPSSARRIDTAAFSPDGSRVVTAQRDRTARVWDAATGRLLFTLGHRASVHAAAFSPDGARIVTASSDNTAKLWSADTGQPIALPLVHLDRVQAAAFSPDGKRVATASRDHTARIWDAATGAPVTAPLEHQDAVAALAFSSDGSRIVTAGWDKSARIWDARTGRAASPSLEHQDRVLAVAFSPDGSRVITGSADNAARIWNATTGRLVTAPLEHQDSVTTVAFSPDGTRVLTASEDHSARIWDAATGKPLTAAFEHAGPVTAAAFSPDGTHVLTAGGTLARLWDLPLDAGSLDQWLELARCAPFAILEGVLTINSDPRSPCR